MPKRSSKKKKNEEAQEPDVNQLATGIVIQATGVEKNPAAVALGRLGGLKGGKARAEKLSAKRRKEIARKAAKKRWSNRPPQGV